VGVGNYLIKEFDLVNYYDKKYNIFFCGDLNFRLNSNINENNEKFTNQIKKLKI
jgi:hypothetical protein